VQNNIGSRDVTVEDIDTAPPNLPAVNFKDWHAEYLKIHDKFTTVSDDLIELREQLLRERENNQTRKILDNLIIPYAGKAYYFMIIYCSFVASILLIDGFGVRGYRIPDSTLGYLVGSTAVTVIGLVGMVLSGVFLGGAKR
jgi:hypothetical protein